MKLPMFKTPSVNIAMKHALKIVFHALVPYALIQAVVVAGLGLCGVKIFVEHGLSIWTFMVCSYFYGFLDGFKAGITKLMKDLRTRLCDEYNAALAANGVAHIKIRYPE